MTFEPADIVEFDATITYPTSADPTPQPVVVRGYISKVCDGRCHIAVMHKGQTLAEWAMANEWLRKVKPGT